MNLATTYLRLRGDVSIEALPVDALFWPKLMAGQLGDFKNEYLVTSHEYTADWPQWEMHPHGDEVVCLLSGSVRLILESGGGEREVTLQGCGSFVVVPKGTWHTARVPEPSRLLFITAGEGTLHRHV